MYGGTGYFVILNPKRMPRGIYPRKKGLKNRSSAKSPSSKNRKVSSTGESYNVQLNGTSINVSNHSMPVIRTALEHELVLATRRVEEVKKALAEIPTI